MIWILNGLSLVNLIFIIIYRKDTVKVISALTFTLGLILTYCVLGI